MKIWLTVYAYMSYKVMLHQLGTLCQARSIVFKFMQASPLKIKGLPLIIMDIACLQQGDYTYMTSYH